MLNDVLCTELQNDTMKEYEDRITYYRQKGKPKQATILYMEICQNQVVTFNLSC